VARDSGLMWLGAAPLAIRSRPVDWLQAVRATAEGDSLGKAEGLARMARVLWQSSTGSRRQQETRGLETGTRNESIGRTRARGTAGRSRVDWTSRSLTTRTTWPWENNFTNDSGARQRQALDGSSCLSFMR
jgi:hypothetical protein